MLQQVAAVYQVLAHVLRKVQQQRRLLLMLARCRGRRERVHAIAKVVVLDDSTQTTTVRRVYSVQSERSCDVNWRFSSGLVHTMPMPSDANSEEKMGRRNTRSEKRLMSSDKAFITRQTDRQADKQTITPIGTEDNECSIETSRRRTQITTLHTLIAVIAEDCIEK